MSPRKPSAEPVRAGPQVTPAATQATLARTQATQATRARTQATRADAPLRRRSRSAHDGPEAPMVLDRYRLIRRLGTGAFGTVWMAHDERLGRDVAVKVLAPERIVGGRFEREARAAARLTHPGIVTLYEAAVDDEGAYLVSQLVLGDTLDGLLEDGCLSDRDIVAVGIALCDALEHAHGHGIVHRDVKPSNVLIPEAPANAAEVAKLTDFGVARIVDAEQLTLTGDVVGTLAYMAPEQADGLEVGPEADLYALALVLYEALTGVNPVGDSARLRPSRRLGAHLPPLRRQRRDLPRVLGQALDLALRPRPRERGTLEELRWALVQARDEVSDEPGVIGEPWSPLATALHRDDGRDDPLAPDNQRSAEPLDPPGGRLRARYRRPIPWPQRAAGGLGAAGIAAWTATTLHATALAPAPAALAAAAAILLLPRVGWFVLVAVTSVAAAVTGLPGLAVLLAGSLLLAPVLLPGAGGLWGAAAVAPALGLIGIAGLAGAWPALAGRFRTPWRRAGLAALGWIWLLAAGAVAGHGLLAARPATSPAPGGLEHSVTLLLHGVVAPAVSSGAWIPALVWAAAAAILPWLVEPAPTVRSRALRALAWSVAVGIAPAVALGLLAGPVHAPAPAAFPVSVLACLAVILGDTWLMGVLPRFVRGREDPILS